MLECKVLRAIGILHKLKSIFLQTIPKQFCFALIHCYLEINFFIFLHKLKILYNKAIRWCLIIIIQPKQFLQFFKYALNS